VHGIDRRNNGLQYFIVHDFSPWRRGGKFIRKKRKRLPITLRVALDHKCFKEPSAKGKEKEGKGRGEAHRSLLGYGERTLCGFFLGGGGSRGSRAGY